VLEKEKGNKRKVRLKSNETVDCFFIGDQSHSM